LEREDKVVEAKAKAAAFFDHIAARVFIGHFDKVVYYKEI